MALGTTATCPVCDEKLVARGGPLNSVVECFCAQRGYHADIATATQMHINYTTTHCGVCACEIKTVYACVDMASARATEQTQCRCCVNTFTATYAALCHEPNTFKIQHARATLEAQRRKTNAEAFCNWPANYKPPGALTDGLATLCDPHRDPWCIRCERLPAANANGLCSNCYPTMVCDQHESMDRTVGAGKLLPRPGAIVLCVDDPNGDDVAEEV